MYLNKKYSYTRFIVAYLLPMYLLLLALMAVYRGVFIGTFLDEFKAVYSFSSSQMHSDFAKSIAKGIRLDLTLLSVCFLGQLLLLFVLYVVKCKAKTSVLISRILYFALAIVILILLNLDLPYYEYFGQHPGNEIFDWLFFGNTFAMAFQETSYYLYYGLFTLSLVFLVLMSVLLMKFAFRSRIMYLFDNTMVGTVSLILIVALALLGTRGQLSFKKIPSAIVHFTDYLIVSQLTEGPVYHFVSNVSKKNQKIDFSGVLSNEDAKTKLVEQLYICDTLRFDSIKQVFADAEKPLHRLMESKDQRFKGYNVVLIFMESMSYNFLNRQEEGLAVTPFLDSLRQQSLFFDNFYSGGIHTNIGVASTMTSYLPFLDKMMMPRKPRKFDSMAEALKEKGYNYSFFIPHYDTYDNMNIFLESNGVDTLYSQSDYDTDALVNAFGVSDRYLFDYALNKLNNNTNQPFFASILTVGNHPPFIIPEEYNIFKKDIYSAAYYADQNLKYFLTEAEKQPWADSTLFVLLADHGKIIDRDSYDVPRSLNHIPLFIYNPQGLAPQMDYKVGSQIDLIPTLMDLIGIDYYSDAYGKSLMQNECTEYVAYCTANHLAVASKEYLFTYEVLSGNEKLYLLSDPEQKNIIADHQALAQEMKEFGVARLIYSNNHYFEAEDK